MTALRHYVGNTSPPLDYQFRVPVDGATNPDDPSQQEPYPFPTGTTVRFFLRELDSTTLRVSNGTADIVAPSATLPTDANAGLVRYTWTAPDVALPAGEFVGWFRVTFPGGATQDSPEFLLELAEHYDGAAGAYTSPGSLKDFTGLTALKTASDEWLATNVIPRAEAWLTAFGPFVSPTCPQLGLAANLLAEAIFERVDPAGRNRSSLEGVKSESIGDYSYTLGDVAASSEGSTPWDMLLAEIDAILSPCRAPEHDAGGVLYGSEGDAFVRLPLDTYDGTGELVTAFSVNDEIMALHAAIEVWR